MYMHVQDIAQLLYHISCRQWLNAETVKLPQMVFETVITTNRIINAVLTKSEQLLMHMAYLTTRYINGNLIRGGGREGIAGETLHTEFVGDGGSRFASLVAMNLVSNTPGTQPLVLRPLRTPGSEVKGQRSHSKAIDYTSSIHV